MYAAIAKQRNNLQLSKDGAVKVPEQTKNVQIKKQETPTQRSMSMNLQYRSHTSNPSSALNERITDADQMPTLKDLGEKKVWKGFGQPDYVPDIQDHFIQKKPKSAKHPLNRRQKKSRQMSSKQNLNEGLNMIVDPKSKMSNKMKTGFLLEMMNMRNEVKLPTASIHNELVNIEVPEQKGYVAKKRESIRVSQQTKGLKQLRSPYEIDEQTVIKGGEMILQENVVIVTEPAQEKSRAVQIYKDPEDQLYNEQLRITNEINSLKMQSSKEISSKQRKLKKKERKAKSPENEEVGDAFMTQPKVFGGSNEDVDPEDLKVYLPPRKDFKAKDKAQHEQKVKKVLNYLGIKDDQMLDHMDPNFQSALEKKTTEKLRAIKEQTPSYAEHQIIQIPKPEDQRHYYIEKYASTGTKIVPLGRSLARIADNEGNLQLVKVEKTQYPSTALEVPKRLKVCKFQDSELQMMCGKQMEKQREEWKLIQIEKYEKQGPYLEQIENAQTKGDMHMTQILKQQMKTRLHQIHKKLMEALEQARIEKGLMTEAEKKLIEDLIREPFDPESFVDNQFAQFNINDLRDHQQTILNVFHQFSNAQADQAIPFDDKKLEQLVQQKQMLPSFKEKMAFINSLKRRWKEQKGYCSLFEKARNVKYKQHKKQFLENVRKSEFAQKRTMSAGEFGRKSRQPAHFLHIHTTSSSSHQKLDIQQKGHEMVIRDNSEIHKRATSLTQLQEETENILSPYKTEKGSLLINPQASGKVGETTGDPKSQAASLKSIKEWGNTFGDSMMKAKAEEMLGKDAMTRNGPSNTTLFNAVKQDMATLEKFLNDKAAEPSRAELLEEEISMLSPGTEEVKRQVPKTKEGKKDFIKANKQMSTTAPAGFRDPQTKVIGSKISSCLISPNAKQGIHDKMHGKEKEREKMKEIMQDMKNLQHHFTSSKLIDNTERTQIIAESQPVSAKDRVVLSIEQPNEYRDIQPPYEVELQGKKTQIEKTRPQTHKQARRDNPQYAYPGIIGPDLEGLSSNNPPSIAKAITKQMPSRAKSGGILRQKLVKTMQNQNMGKSDPKESSENTKAQPIQINTNSRSLSPQQSAMPTYLDNMTRAFVDWQKVLEEEEKVKKVLKEQPLQNAHIRINNFQGNFEVVKPRSSSRETKQKKVLAMTGQHYTQAMKQNALQKGQDPNFPRNLSAVIIAQPKFQNQSTLKPKQQKRTSTDSREDHYAMYKYQDPFMVSGKTLKKDNFNSTMVVSQKETSPSAERISNEDLRVQDTPQLVTRSPLDAIKIVGQNLADGNSTEEHVNTPYYKSEGKIASGAQNSQRSLHQILEAAQGPEVHKVHALINAAGGGVSLSHRNQSELISTGRIRPNTFGLNQGDYTNQSNQDSNLVSQQSRELLKNVKMVQDNVTITNLPAAEIPNNIHHTSFSKTGDSFANRAALFDSLNKQPESQQFTISKNGLTTIMPLVPAERKVVQTKEYPFELLQLTTNQSDSKSRSGHKTSQFNTNEVPDVQTNLESQQITEIPTAQIPMQQERVPHFAYQKKERRKFVHKPVVRSKDNSAEGPRQNPQYVLEDKQPDGLRNSLAGGIQGQSMQPLSITQIISQNMTQSKQHIGGKRPKANNLEEYISFKRGTTLVLNDENEIGETIDANKKTIEDIEY